MPLKLLLVSFDLAMIKAERPDEVIVDDFRLRHCRLVLGREELC